MFSSNPYLRVLCVLCGSLSAAAVAVRAEDSTADVVAALQPKVVKLHGAGGPRGLEAYQTGMLISPDGHILTAWSYVLDTPDLSVTLHDGRKFAAKLVGADVRLEIAVLKIDGANLPSFNLAESTTPDVGASVIALTNLYGVAAGNESLSVQRGVVAARTTLQARRGTYSSPYDGPIVVVDAVTNNPGTAGGAVTDRRGRLIGMVGKELRHARTGAWLNYALPINELKPSIDDILAGRSPSKRDAAKKKPREPHDLDGLGMKLVADVVPRTPPYIDRVEPGSLAAQAGLRPDDLVLLVGDQLVGSCLALRDELQRIDRIDPVKLTVQRGNDLVEVQLEPRR